MGEKQRQKHGIIPLMHGIVWALILVAIWVISVTQWRNQCNHAVGMLSFLTVFTMFSWFSVFKPNYNFATELIISLITWHVKRDHPKRQSIYLYHVVLITVILVILWFTILPEKCGA